jgi:hypothetical protein
MTFAQVSERLEKIDRESRERMFRKPAGDPASGALKNGT